MRDKPRIGLTMRLELETRRFYLGRDYSEALAFFGAVPVHLPLIPDEHYIENALKYLDGILLPGSDTDVDPHNYGEEPHPKIKKIIYEKDATDWFVLKYAEKMNLPILAICYGMQILNVFRGGSLYQDINSQIMNPVKHEQGIPLERNSHKVEVIHESKLSKIILKNRIPPDIKVNSHHHQAINNLGRNLIKAAFASDGIIEAVEDVREDKYVLGVQWHPELSYKSDNLSESIFKDFVSKCSETRS